MINTEKWLGGTAHGYYGKASQTSKFSIVCNIVEKGGVRENVNIRTIYVCNLLEETEVCSDI